MSATALQRTKRSLYDKADSAGNRRQRLSPQGIQLLITAGQSTGRGDSPTAQVSRQVLQSQSDGIKTPHLTTQVRPAIRSKLRYYLIVTPLFTA